jgi:hypothetical protein
LTQRKTILRGGLVAAVVLVALVATAVLLPVTASAHGGAFGWPDGRVSMGLGGPDRDGLLADALGISAEELQAARQKAAEAAIEQALESERIDQDQADRMRAAIKLAPYLDRKALTAAALGMTVEELEAAHEADKTLADLMAERDLDRATLRDKLDAARDAAIDKAVADGAVSAEQAEALEEQAGGCGMGRHGLGGRHGGMMFRGQFGSEEGAGAGVARRGVPGNARFFRGAAPGWSGAGGAIVTPSGDA